MTSFSHLCKYCCYTTMSLTLYYDATDMLYVKEQEKEMKVLDIHSSSTSSLSLRSLAV